MRMPAPRMATPKKAQGMALPIHSLWSRNQRPDKAMAKGISVLANPRNRVGGWMTIQ